MHIGLIGGIGPAATAAYYQRLVDVFHQADVRLQLTIQHADIDTLTVNAIDLDENTQAAVFLEHIKSLRRAGCDVVGITALTGHFCMPALQHLSDLPVLSATEAIEAHCRVNGIERLGLLGSPPVLNTHLFGLLREVDTVVPADTLDVVGQTYLEIARKGACTADQATLFLSAGAEMVRTQNADAILLAGTDLGLAFNGSNPSYPVVDALEIHVDAFLRNARQQT